MGGFEVDYEESADYLPSLDLSQCFKLHTISIKFEMYVPGGHQWRPHFPRECRVARSIPKFLQSFLAECNVPVPFCLDIQTCVGIPTFLGHVGTFFNEIDDLMMENIQSVATIKGITLNSWGLYESDSILSWEMISELFPRLLEAGLLHR